MAHYLERYQNGEHASVWGDLVALGTAVHREHVLPDALAVARETMRRARANVETVIVRLDGIGYRFKTARDTPPAVVAQMVQIQREISQRLEAQFPILLEVSGRETRFEEFLAGFDKGHAPASTLDEVSVYFRAGDWSGPCIDSLQSYLAAPMPLSLRAWYECISHVSFCGSHPILNPEETDRLIEPPAALPDPLSIMSMPDEADYQSWETPEGYPIAVDEFFKAGIHRDHRYYMDFRDSRADSPFRDWRGDYFVGFLRRAFKWGGFPGWERHPNPPLKLIAELTDGLLAI